MTRVRSPDYETHVDILCARSNAATLPLTSFWCTTVMNYITRDKLVVMYPKTTLAKQGWTNPAAHRERKKRVKKKYKERGFDIRGFPHNRDDCKDAYKYCPSILRYTEDSQSMIIPWNDPSDALRHSAIAPSFKHIAFAAQPSFWRWSSCPLKTDRGGMGYTMGRL